VRRLLIALACCLFAAPAFAQTSPDPTEADHFTDAQGHAWTIDVANGYHTLRDGVWVGGGVAAFYLYQCGEVYAWNGSPVWLHLVNDEWLEPSGTRPVRTCGSTPPPPPPVVTPPPPPPPTPPVLTVPSSTFCVGDAPKVQAAHDGALTASFRLYQDGVLVQTQPVSALSGGVVTFALSPLTALGTPTFTVAAVNAAGESKSAPVSISVVAKFDFVVKGWPGGQSGSRSFSYVSNYPIGSFVVSWPLKVIATATNGCTVTVTK
jgi:hypothetical protein